MKDLHNHLLYGIDDGSDSLEESIKLLNKLEQEGVTDIVVTPHYIIGTNYNSNNKTKKKILNELKKYTRINLYLGNEVYIDNNIIEYIKKDEITTINDSKYLLVELPLNEKLNSYMNILFNLRKEGYIPIIAHPERYHYFDIEDLVQIVESGCLLQGNITSLSNRYGIAAKKNLVLLLKKHMIHLLGTDTHKHVTDLSDCLKKLKEIINYDMFNDITELNFDKVINNEEIVQYEIINTNNFFRKEHIR